MFVLLWSDLRHKSDRGIYYNTYNVVEKDSEFRCGILDTDDFSEDIFQSRDELESLLKKCPDIEISGLKHNNGTVTSIYYFHSTDYMAFDDYYLFYVRNTNRGSYAICNLYKKGYGKVASWDTIHAEGCYDFYLSISDVEHRINEEVITIKTEVRSKRRSFEISPYIFYLRNNSIFGMKSPSANEV